MKWKVFLPGNCIERVENRVHELAESVAAFDLMDVGLMGGVAGVACFCAYYADWMSDLRFKGLVGEMVERMLNPPAGHLPGYSFSNGYAGIAWSIHHLIENKLLDLDASQIYMQLDQLLADRMLEEIKRGHYDYLHGALGIAVYFLHQAENNEYRNYLSSLVEELENISIEEADGSIKWNSLLDAESKKEGFNLSMSHGIASIMIIVSMIHQKGIAIVSCERLIKGAYSYLRKQALKATEYISVYPSWAIESMDDPGNSRMAWCYGDMGIGFACMRAGKTLKDEEMYGHGEAILRRSGERRDPEENRVLDAGLCHGAAGLALMFNSLFQIKHDDLFGDAAAYWMDVCLNMAYHSDGIAGYKAWYHPRYGGWVKVPGLLEGAAGIGLTMMSFVSTREPAWRKALLVD
ncbi:MAG: lanthionine synthetase C family protein [Bacteroidales bacterium]|nr:lanthionine synthetase C family protein [Bacteroidales bacterium]